MPAGPRRAPGPDFQICPRSPWQALLMRTRSKIGLNGGIRVSGFVAAQVMSLDGVKIEVSCHRRAGRQLAKA